MRIRSIFLFVFLLAFAKTEAFCRDFAASVAKKGELVSSDTIVRVVRYGTGQYQVTFESAINGCRVSGTIDEVQKKQRLKAAQIITNVRHAGRNDVDVETRAPNGAPADYPFRVMVSCPAPKPPPAPLNGYVDLHTHPLANVGFGGKLLYGGVDVGSLLPADPDCQPNVRAGSMLQALGHDKSTHGLPLPFSNPCADGIRALAIKAVQSANNAADISFDAAGAPDFPEWPVWNDITHQKMWVDWIHRAVASGLRVIVAMAVNNKTLADATAGPCDYRTDDLTSAELQLAEIKKFVERHREFMEVALTADDLARIVRDDRLAVVLGVEIDNIGNLNKVPQPPTHAQISAEIDKLYGQGVRYIFPIHVLDNPFGGTAAYVDLFNYSTFREDGHYWALQCATPLPPDDASEETNYHMVMDTPLDVTLLKIAGKLKLNTSFTNPPHYPSCAAELSPAQPTFSAVVPPGKPNTTFDTIKFIIITGDTGLDTNSSATATLQLKNGTVLAPLVLKKQGDPGWGKFTTNGADHDAVPLSLPVVPPVSAADIAQVVITLASPNSGAGAKWNIGEVSITLSKKGGAAEISLVRRAFGQVNALPLTDAGKFAIREMMRHGMLIDIDHMSDLSKSDTFTIANLASGYPLNSGHSGLRGFFPTGVPRGNGDVSDRSTSIDQYQKIAGLHGMAGVGSADLNAYQWAQLYEQVIAVMTSVRPDAAAGFGTDTDGFAPGMPPRCDPPITATSTGCKTPLATLTYPFTLKVGSKEVSFDVNSRGTNPTPWNYNSDGVAHYGMLADFLKDVLTYPGGGTLTGNELVNNNLMLGAEYFYQTWKICEAKKTNVPPN